jgi:hypothetical protein
LKVGHHAVNLSAGIRVDGPWHVQNVNAYDSRLKGGLRHFHGVSTRTLDSYLGEFRTIERAPGKTLQPAPFRYFRVSVGAIDAEHGRRFHLLRAFGIHFAQSGCQHCHFRLQLSNFVMVIQGIHAATPSPAASMTGCLKYGAISPSCCTMPSSQSPWIE